MTRFAPSPTGYLHLGALRTALYNYLFARSIQTRDSAGSKFILRIEDTDQKRLVQDSVQHIMQTLRWAGIDYDEVHVQSERTDIYRQHASELLQNGSAYKCYCTEERLARMREAEARKGNNTKYDRHCLSLTEQQRRDLDDRGVPFSIRMLVPDGGGGVGSEHQSHGSGSRSSRRPSTTIDDMVFGRIVVPNDTVDDQILLKSDGFPTYHLANVVDDHLMGVTHVIRGMEWISSTPKHIMLYHMFGWEAPVFAHLPLLTTEGGQKLSKRIGHASVDWYREQGFLPDALVNFVAYLGWGPSEEEKKESGEVHTLQQLVDMFTLERVNKGNCMVNLKKLEWINAEHIRAKIESDTQEVLTHVRPLVQERFTSTLGESCSHLLSDEYITQVLHTVKDRMQKYDQFAEYFHYFFTDVDFEQDDTKKFRTKVDKIANREILLRHLYTQLGTLEDDQFTSENIGHIINTTKDDPSIGSPSYKDIVMLLRFYTTGSSIGAGINQTLATLGRDRKSVV